MDRSDYEIVLAVAGLGSIPAAAHALGLDVQAARRRLDGLESRQGVALFSHGPQGSTPTPVGLRLAMLAQSAGKPVEAGGAASWPATAALAGRVRVMADTAMTAALLHPAVSALGAVHERLRIEMAVAARPDDLDNGALEVVVRGSRTVQRFVDTREVPPITLGLFARRDYLAAFGVPAAVQDLRGHTLIVQGADEAVRSALATLGLDGVLDVSDIAVRTPTALASLQAVEAGQGIGLLRLGQVEDAEDLVPVLPALTATLNLRLVAPRHLAGLAHVRIVCDAISRSLQTMADPAPDGARVTFQERQVA
ncbi:MAG TPA: LysR family transcriptional regulator [Caulobacteraceae bacterium]|nr:LysR family transcriptional regulator [Caulobacteraceae bacterium]